MAVPVKAYRALVRYDGTNYSGFQKQPNGNTIQAELEKALLKITKEPVSVQGSGRTDAGVHAHGQIIRFESDANLPEYGWVQALNTYLPKDIRIAWVKECDPEFHPRFHVKKKVYKYIYTLDQSDPFAYRTKSLVFKKPDVSKMIEASRYLLGTHDFSGFTKELEPGKSPVKTIEDISIEQKGQDIELVFTGNGFLRHQVRRMSEALYKIGLGKLSLEKFREMVEAKRVCPYKAKASGLYLMEVIY